MTPEVIREIYFECDEFHIRTKLAAGNLCVCIKQLNRLWKRPFDRVIVPLFLLQHYTIGGTRCEVYTRGMRACVL